MPYFGNGAQNAVLALYCFLVFGTGGAKSLVCGRRIQRVELTS